MTATSIADIAVSVAALCGLLLLIEVIRKSSASSLTRKFLFGLNVIAILLVSRILFWVIGLGIFEIVMLIAAGIIPLAVILLSEDLLRRHAPFGLKIFVAGAAVIFSLLAFFPDHLIEPARTILLLLTQLTGFGAAGFLVVTREKSSLSTGENRVIERIALSLLVIIPLLATDFRFSVIEMPVRLGGIGILALCWLTISLERTHLSNRDMIKAFVMLLIVCAIAAFVLVSIVGMGADTGFGDFVRFTAILLSAMLVVAIYNDSVALRFDDRRNSLLRHLAEGDISSSQAFLQGLQNHVLVEGALILEASDLKDFDLEQLAKIFAQTPIRRLSETRKMASQAKDEDNFQHGEEEIVNREQLQWLFERYDATHIILVSDQPFILVALSLPELASSPGAETELKAVQRMACQIAHNETNKN